MKWTIEWAMRKYGVVKNDTHYYCGDRYIFVTSGAKNTFWLGTPGNNDILKEKAAVKWLVADQPRVEKKRKSEVMDIQYVDRGLVLTTTLGYLELKPDEKIIIEPADLPQYRIRKMRKVQ